MRECPGDPISFLCGNSRGKEWIDDYGALCGESERTRKDEKKKNGGYGNDRRPRDNITMPEPDGKVFMVFVRHRYDDYKGKMKKKLDHQHNFAYKGSAGGRVIESIAGCDRSGGMMGC